VRGVEQAEFHGDILHGIRSGVRQSGADIGAPPDETV
jgi:hypothetical protein